MISDEEMKRMNNMDCSLIWDGRIESLLSVVSLCFN